MSVRRTANLFLVGAPRAGTTSLFDYLSRHPAIYAPAEKEPHRYDDDVLDGRPGMEADDYDALYADAAGERWLLDASALYLYSQHALDVISGIPDAHAVISLRDPIEQMASWHGLLVATASEPCATLEEALAAETRATPFARRYREVARYAPYVEQWIDRLGAERVHVVLFEELTGERSEAVGRGLLAALGLADESLGAFPHLNTYRRPAPVRLTGSPGVRRLARLLLPSSVRRRLWRTAHAAMTPHAQRPAVSPTLRARLEHELAADNRRLEAVLGRSVAGLWSA